MVHTDADPDVACSHRVEVDVFPTFRRNMLPSSPRKKNVLLALFGRCPVQIPAAFLAILVSFPWTISETKR